MDSKSVSFCNMDAVLAIVNKMVGDMLSSKKITKRDIRKAISKGEENAREYFASENLSEMEEGDIADIIRIFNVEIEFYMKTVNVVADKATPEQVLNLLMVGTNLVYIINKFNDLYG